MPKSVLRIAAATALFAGVHSLLASLAAKRAAARLLGERRRNALYRPFYNAQAVLTFGALTLYISGLPGRDIYRVKGRPAWLMRAGQAASLLYILYGARQIGLLRFSGLSNLAALVKGEPVIEREPEGQGPALQPGTGIKATGPFKSSRHPLNFAILPLLWLSPAMTTNLLSFTVISTLYAVAGSIHEEARLSRCYGAPYEKYQESGISFFVPLPGSRTDGA